MSVSIIRSRKNRRFGSQKNSVHFHTTVPQEVLNFIDEAAVRPDGLKRSRGEILEMLVEIAKSALANRQE